MMKKILYFLLALFVLIFFMPCRDAVALNDNEDIETAVEEGFFGGLDGELSDLLEDFGLTYLDGDSVFTDGTENIKNYFSVTFKDKLQGAAGWFFLGICIIMLLSLISGAFDFSSSCDAFSLFSAAIICLLTVGKISSFINCVLSAMELNGKFMLTFIPVYALLVSLSGNPASALTYNSFMLFFCEGISFFLKNMFVSVIGLYFAFSISFSFNTGINLNRFTNSVNRLASLVLGFSASMFTGLLSLENVLAVSADSLSVKGVRFMLGSMIPVIGSSLSEAYSSVLGSINLMKSSLAVIGIFAIVIINIPALTEGVIYFFLITLLSCFAEILGLSRVSEIYRSLAGCVRILLLVCFFQIFILIISIGLMLTLRGVTGG